MVAMMHMLKNLSVQEKEAIMEVLSRDRRLRETEEERVMRLRIELARERRAGFVLSEHGKPLRKRTCARCRESVGFIGKARCPICNHIICKNCRVTRQASERQSLNQMEDSAHVVSTKKTADRAVQTIPSKKTKKDSVSHLNQTAGSSPATTLASRIRNVGCSEIISEPEVGSFGVTTRMLTSTNTPAKFNDLKPAFLKAGVEQIEPALQSNKKVPRNKEQKSANVGGMFCMSSSERPGDSEVNESVSEYAGHSDHTVTDRIDNSDYESIQEASTSYPYAAGTSNRFHISQIRSVQTSSSEFNEKDAVTFLKEMGLKNNFKSPAKTKSIAENSVKAADDHEIAAAKEHPSLDAECASIHAIQDNVIMNETSSQNSEHPPPINAVSKSDEKQQSSKSSQINVENTSQIVATQQPKTFTAANEFFATVGKLFDFKLFKKTFYGIPIPVSNLPRVNDEKELSVEAASQASLKVEHQTADEEKNTVISGDTKPDSNITTANSDNALQANVDTHVEQEGHSNTLVEQVDDKGSFAANLLHEKAPSSIASTPPASESYSSEIHGSQVEDISTVYQNMPAVSEDSRNEESSTETLVRYPRPKQREDKIGKSLTYRHDNNGNGARRRVRKTLKQRMNATKTHLRHPPSSSDGDEPSKFTAPLVQPAMHENTTDVNQGLTNQPRSQSISVSQTATNATQVISDSEVMAAVGQWRRASLNMGLFNRFRSKILMKTEFVPWVCKVCAKSLDLNKKSGDWFYKAARSEVLEFKENLALNKDNAAKTDLSFMVSRNADEKPSTVSSDAELKPVNLTEPVGRARSHTVETLVLPRHLTSDDPAIGLEKQASIKRRRLRLSRKSVAEVLHGSLLIHIPGMLLFVNSYAVHDH